MLPRLLRRFSLKSRLSLLTLAIFLLGIWSITLYATQRMQADMLALLGIQQVATVSTVAAQLDHELKLRLAALEQVADGVARPLLDNPTALQAHVASRADLQALFNGGVQVHNAQAKPFAGLPDAAGHSPTEGIDPENSLTALREGRTTLGKPTRHTVTGAPTLTMAAPVFNADGKARAVVVGIIQLEQAPFIQQAMHNRPGQTGGYLVMAPAHKLIVVGTDPTRTLTPLPAPGVNSNHDRFMSGYEGYGVAVNSRGTEELAAARQLPTAHWLLVGVWPTAELLAPIKATQQRVLAVAVAASLLAGLLVWVFVRFMLRQQFAPMVAATKALSGMTGQAGAALQAAHNLQPLPVQHDDEVGQLIGSFNRLIASVLRNEAALKHDLDERMRVEAALRESEFKHRVLFETSPDAIMTLAPPSWQFASGNQAAIALFAAQNEADLTARPPWQYSPELQPDGKPSADQARHMIETALRNGSHTFEWVHERLSGEPFHATVVLSRFELGGQAFLQANVRNITAHKQAEAALRLAASVYTHTHEGISITDRDGNIVDVNAAFTAITGYSRDEVLGKNPRILSSGKQNKAFYTAMWQSLQVNGSWKGEIWNRHKDGNEFAELLTISTVRDNFGAVQNHIALFTDITAIKGHQTQLEHLAHYDALTGLPNRLLLADRLRQAMNLAPRRGQHIALAYLDLDGFKAINDLHGHEVGDLLLKAIAHNMKLVLRDSDTLARLGGDEFVAVLVDLPATEASVPMFTRLLDAASQPLQVADHVLQVTASLGVTFYPQADDMDADQLLRQADQAMYMAKQAGKNRYHVFDAEQDRNLRGRHENLTHIRQALAQNEFVLHYQPKVNMRTGKVLGAEALIRWQHPQRGLLPPGVFLPTIEGHPLSIDLGEWVIDNALSQIEAWHAMGLTLPVSVNVGALQLQQPAFVSRLRTLMLSHPGVQRGELELEVLETSALEDFTVVSQVMAACHDMGIGFALDDFGTGYSSLTYLKQLPTGLLKIDQSFVRDMLDDPDDLAILEGVLGLAKAFKRQVIAEGVETPAHAELLLRLGCEWAQGYAIAHPMPPSDLPTWVTSWRAPASWQALTRIPADRMAVLHATVAHRAWVADVVRYLRGHCDAPPPQAANQCALSVWLHDDHSAQSLLDSHTLQAVATEHRHLHARAADLIALKSAGHTQQALSGVDELYRLRDSLLGLLSGLF